MTQLQKQINAFLTGADFRPHTSMVINQGGATLCVVKGCHGENGPEGPDHLINVSGRDALHMADWLAGVFLDAWISVEGSLL